MVVIATSDLTGTRTNVAGVTQKQAIDAATNIVPLVTPLLDGMLDTNSLERLVAHASGLGHTHLFPGGETGEFRTIPNAMRLAVAEVVLKNKGKGQFVFGHATAEDTATTCGNIDRLVAMGADAIVVAPHVLDNFGMFRSLADMQVDVPLFLYNNPGISNGRNISVGELQGLAGKIKGLKDSSGDPARLKEYLAVGSELGFAVYQGNEKDIANHHQLMLGSAGIRGVVASMGNLNNMPLAFFDGRLLSGESASHWQGSVDRCVDLYTCSRERIKGGIKFLLAKLNILRTCEVRADADRLLPKHIELLERAFDHEGGLIWHGV